ncbi:uncharacterized protein EDB93DRAFT_1105379 [Suillus bovinus]|uniref:uncharacterized protein n=1 Tax=Suillus bovinus TaxID=48563 RepID=UPI001B86893A|nr:uncharacterized protein EDB93DRAFT_1105379 [Suillus bovinus]KAG2142893.1 hypothetical protein EDB93DRAFT_1105379 [Suillus bovinus]
MDSDGAGGLFQYVSHSPPQCSIAAGRTLASLARTSKVFHHVATRALWSRLDGLTPLLRPLASDLILIPETARPQPVSTIRRPLKMAEWEILRGLARRVEHLCVHDPARPVDVSIVLSLCHPPTNSPLFPNLKSILWNDERAETFPFIRTLSGPTVTSLAITITNNSRKWHIPELSIFASLPYICPNVTEVTLPTDAFPSLSEALCAWNNLEEIKCGVIEGNALTHLARQSALRKLSFNIKLGLGLDSSLPSGAFSCVRDFEIHATNMSFLDPFFNRLGGSPASMHVLVDTNPPPTSITSLFTTLRRFSSTRLQDLSLRLRTPPSPRVLPPHPLHPFTFPQPTANVGPYMAPPTNMISYPISVGYQPPLAQNGFHVLPSGSVSTSGLTCHTLTLRDFMPLTCFESLGRIDIDINHSIHLDDDGLRSLVSAWPHLYSFSLNDTAGWRTKSGITQIGLIAMLDCCPELQKLCIALNTDAFIEVPSDREGIENTAMRTLGLADSLIEARATVAVAAFLSDIFPNLTTIVAWDSIVMSRRLNAGMYAERWMHVSEQVHGMNKVRVQERKWWLSDDDGESEACAISQV